MAIVGGGPAGLACAIKLMQLLEDEPELTEKLGEVPVAVVEKGKTPGAHLLSGANMTPVGDAGAVPGPRSVGVARLPGGHQGRGLLAHLEDGAAAEADAAELPQPRQLRHLGREAGPLPRREGRGGGRLHPQRDRGGQAAGRGPDRPRRALRRQGPRQGRRGALQLRARLRRGRQGDRARRGHHRPSDRRGARLLRPARPRPAALGARREGGLGGARSRSTASSTRSAGRFAGAPSTRSRRQLHLPDGRGQGLHRPRRRPRHHRRDLLRPRRAAGAQDPPVRPEDPRGRQAGRLGREDDPLGRLLVDAEAALQSRHGDLRRRRRHGQRPDAEGHPLRDARRHVRGRGDRRVAEAGVGQLRELRAQGQGLGHREGPLAVAQHAPAALEGLDLRRDHGQR